MVVAHETPSELTPIVAGGALKVLELLQPIGTGKEGKGLEMTLLASRGMTHDSLLLAEALRSRRGRIAWAPRRTLIVILRRKPAPIKFMNQQQSGRLSRSHLYLPSVAQKHFDETTRVLPPAGKG